MMGIEEVGSNGERVIDLNGSWTVARSFELKQALGAALAEFSRIVISPAELEEADLSCLQLLCAAHRKSLSLGKILELHPEKSDAFRRLARDAGFVRTLGCHQDPSLSCLWTGGWA